MTITLVLGSSSIAGRAAEMPLMIFLFNSVKWLKAATSKDAAQLKKTHMLMAFKADGRSSKIVLA